MDSALVATVLIGVAGTAVVFLIIWASSQIQLGREEEIELIAGHELHKWADRQGWRMCDKLPRPLADPWVHETTPGERLVRAAEGGYGAHRAAIGLYTQSAGDGTRPFLACLVELPTAQPSVRIRQRHAVPIRPRNPNLPDRATPDRDFDRAVKVQSYSDVDVGRLLSAPVRAALLRLCEVAPWEAEFVRMNGRTLRVVLGGWPPRVDLTRLMDGLTDLVTALSPSD